jgi:hypothetical protein
MYTKHFESYEFQNIHEAEVLRVYVADKFNEQNQWRHQFFREIKERVLIVVIIFLYICANCEQLL